MNHQGRVGVPQVVESHVGEPLCSVRVAARGRERAGVERRAVASVYDHVEVLPAIAYLRPAVPLALELTFEVRGEEAGSATARRERRVFGSENMSPWLVGRNVRRTCAVIRCSSRSAQRSPRISVRV